MCLDKGKNSSTFGEPTYCIILSDACLVKAGLIRKFSAIKASHEIWALLLAPSLSISLSLSLSCSPSFPSLSVAHFYFINILRMDWGCVAFECCDKKPRDKLRAKSSSGCGSVGRAVASDTRGPRFESSHMQKFYWTTVLKRLEKN